MNKSVKVLLLLFIGIVMSVLSFGIPLGYVKYIELPLFLLSLLGLYLIYSLEK